MAWLAELEAEIDWDDPTTLAVQVNGSDLIRIIDIDETTGFAEIVVYTSTDEKAPVLFRGRVNVKPTDEDGANDD
ncbi:hypothetical protein [Agromyces humi]|uniref:hypothetical protein n=1 Tax=Agromyces humi TaxID=1766800 RepID=UPI001358D7CA|nr:hypothetical protein [Agromyces humi]